LVDGGGITYFNTDSTDANPNNGGGICYGTSGAATVTVDTPSYYYLQNGERCAEGDELSSVEDC
jgi:hypothetical protein